MKGRHGHPLHVRHQRRPFHTENPATAKLFLTLGGRRCRRLYSLASVQLRAAMAFEHADRLPGLGVHHLADDDWLSAAFTCRLLPGLGAWICIATHTVHYSLRSSELS